MVAAVVQVAANCAPRRRSQKATAGPISRTTAARMAGRRSAANDSPVRSSMCPIESVSACRSGLASTVPMSGTNGKWREFHSPAASTAEIAMQITASAPELHRSQRREPDSSSFASLSCNQQQDRKVGRESVVLLIRGEGEKDERNSSPDQAKSIPFASGNSAVAETCVHRVCDGPSISQSAAAAPPAGTDSRGIARPSEASSRVSLSACCSPWECACPGSA